MRIEVKGRHRPSRTTSGSTSRSASPRWASRCPSSPTLEIELSEEQNPSIPERVGRGDAPSQGRDAARPRRLAATWPTRSTSARTSSRARSSATATSAASGGRRAPRPAAAGHGAGHGRRHLRRDEPRRHGLPPWHAEGARDGPIMSRLAPTARSSAATLGACRLIDRALRMGEAKKFRRYEQRVARINELEPELRARPTRSCAERPTRCAARARPDEERSPSRSTSCCTSASRSCARPAGARWACATSTSR